MISKLAAALSALVGIASLSAHAEEPHPYAGVWAELAEEGVPNSDDLSKACNLAPWVMYESGLLFVYDRSELNEPMKVTWLASCTHPVDGIEACVPIDQDSGFPNFSEDPLLGSYESKGPDRVRYCPLNAETKEVEGDCIMTHRCDPAFYADDTEPGHIPANIMFP